MILLNRLEKFAKQQGFFSNLQFGFEEGVGCIEASFTILETINHMLERGSKVVSLTSVKPLIRFGLMGYCISCSQNLELKAKCG